MRGTTLRAEEPPVPHGGREARGSEPEEAEAPPQGPDGGPDPRPAERRRSPERMKIAREGIPFVLGFLSLAGVLALLGAMLPGLSGTLAGTLAFVLAAPLLLLG